MLSYHFGWSIEYILGLAPVQFSMMMDGLGEILSQMNDPNYHDKEKMEIDRKISEMKAQQIVKSKGKGKLKLEDLM